MTHPIDDFDARLQAAKTRLSAPSPYTPPPPTPNQSPTRSPNFVQDAPATSIVVATFVLLIIGLNVFDRHPPLPVYAAAERCVARAQAFNLDAYNACIADEQIAVDEAKARWNAAPQPVREWCEASVAASAAFAPSYRVLEACLAQAQDRPVRQLHIPGA